MQMTVRTENITNIETFDIVWSCFGQCVCVWRLQLQHEPALPVRAATGHSARSQLSVGRMCVELKARTRPTLSND